jgi:hypothetical protein
MCKGGQLKKLGKQKKNVLREKEISRKVTSRSFVLSFTMQTNFYDPSRTIFAASFVICLCYSIEFSEVFGFKHGFLFDNANASIKITGLREGHHEF